MVVVIDVTHDYLQVQAFQYGMLVVFLGGLIIFIIAMILLIRFIIHKPLYQLADASDAVVIGFNVVPDDRARSLAEDRGVQVRRYDIIYQVTGDLRQALEGMLAPERQEVELGRALVQRTFSISRIGVIAGCRVVGGIISRNGRLRIIRDSRVLGDYPVDTLRREKDDAKEVRAGRECGIKVAGFNDVKEGDILECYKIEEVARTLS